MRVLLFMTILKTTCLYAGSFLRLSFELFGDRLKKGNDRQMLRTCTFALSALNA